jgi:hypothetical protein
MPDSSIIGGYYADPVTMYGPSASRVAADRSGTEPGTVDDTPLWGPAPSGGMGLPSVGEFFHSPAGMILVALGVAYFLFAKVFGVS